MSDQLYEDIEDPFFSVVQETSYAETPAVSEISSKELQDLKGQNSTLVLQNAALKKNISCLYKTAHLEIERKDSMIEELRERVKSLETDVAAGMQLFYQQCLATYYTTSQVESLITATSQQQQPHDQQKALMDHLSASGGAGSQFSNDGLPIFIKQALSNCGMIGDNSAATAVGYDLQANGLLRESALLAANVGGAENGDGGVNDDFLQAESHISSTPRVCGGRAVGGKHLNGCVLENSGNVGAQCASPPAWASQEYDRAKDMSTVVRGGCTDSIGEDGLGEGTPNVQRHARHHSMDRDHSMDRGGGPLKQGRRHRKHGKQTHRDCHTSRHNRGQNQIQMNHNDCSSLQREVSPRCELITPGAGHGGIHLGSKCSKRTSSAQLPEANSSLFHERRTRNEAISQSRRRSEAMSPPPQSRHRSEAMSPPPQSQHRSEAMSPPQSWHKSEAMSPQSWHKSEAMSPPPQSRRRSEAMSPPPQSRHRSEAMSPPPQSQHQSEPMSPLSQHSSEAVSPSSWRKSEAMSSRSGHRSEAMSPLSYGHEAMSPWSQCSSLTPVSGHGSITLKPQHKATRSKPDTLAPCSHLEGTSSRIFQDQCKSRQALNQQRSWGHRSISPRFRLQHGSVSPSKSQDRPASPQSSCRTVKHRSRQRAVASYRTNSPRSHDRAVSPNTSYRTKSPKSHDRAVKHRSRQKAVANHMTKSPRLHDRAVSPSTSYRTKSPRSHDRAVSPSTSYRTKSPRSHNRAVSPSTSYRTKSPRSHDRAVSPNTSYRTKSPRSHDRVASPRLLLHRTHGSRTRHREVDPWPSHRIASPQTSSTERRSKYRTMSPGTDSPRLQDKTLSPWSRQSSLSKTRCARRHGTSKRTLSTSPSSRQKRMKQTHDDHHATASRHTYTPSPVSQQHHTSRNSFLWTSQSKDDQASCQDDDSSSVITLGSLEDDLPIDLDNCIEEEISTDKYSSHAEKAESDDGELLLGDSEGLSCSGISQSRGGSRVSLSHEKGMENSSFSGQDRTLQDQGEDVVTSEKSCDGFQAEEMTQHHQSRLSANKMTHHHQCQSSTTDVGAKLHFVNNLLSHNSSASDSNRHILHSGSDSSIHLNFTQPDTNFDIRGPRCSDSTTTASCHSETSHLGIHPTSSSSGPGDHCASDHLVQRLKPLSSGSCYQSPPDGHDFHPLRRSDMHVQSSGTSPCHTSLGESCNTQAGGDMFSCQPSSPPQSPSTGTSTFYPTSSTPSHTSSGITVCLPPSSSASEWDCPLTPRMPDPVSPVGTTPTHNTSPVISSTLTECVDPTIRNVLCSQGACTNGATAADQITSLTQADFEMLASTISSSSTWLLGNPLTPSDHGSPDALAMSRCGVADSLDHSLPLPLPMGDEPVVCSPLHSNVETRAQVTVLDSSYNYTVEMEGCSVTACPIITTCTSSPQTVVPRAPPTPNTSATREQQHTSVEDGEVTGSSSDEDRSDNVHTESSTREGNPADRLTWDSCVTRKLHEEYPVQDKRELHKEYPADRLTRDKCITQHHSDHHGRQTRTNSVHDRPIHSDHHRVHRRDRDHGATHRRHERHKSSTSSLDRSRSCDKHHGNHGRPRPHGRPKPQM